MRKFTIAMLLALLALGAETAVAQAQKGRALPSKAQRAWLVKDRLYVEVGVPNMIDPDPSNDPNQDGLVDGMMPSYPYGEHFGNRLGDVIQFRVRIFAVRPADDKHIPVQLDLSALKAGRLTFDPDPENDPDWVIAKPEVLASTEKPLLLPERPQLVTIRTPDGKERDADLWDIRVFVQTKRRPDPMNFWVEFAYATEVTPNGSLDWKLASSPDFVVSQSRTSDNGNDLCMGNTSLVNAGTPRVLPLLLCTLGVVLVLIPTGRAAMKAIRPLMRRELAQDPAERAWEQLQPVLDRTRTADGGYCFSEADVAVVVQAVKEFFGITYGVEQLFERRFAVDDGEELYKVLYSLEHGVLENGAKLTEKDYGKLVARIERLVPKP